MKRHHDLIAAVKLGDLNSVRLLIKQGANVISPALREAVAAGNLAIVRLLIEAGADPLEKDAAGCTALQIAASKGRRRILDLVTKAADIKSLSADVSLHEAAEFGLLTKVHRLIQEGTGVDLRTVDGATALMLAARNGHRDVVRALLAAGADPNAVADDGVNALHWAANGKGSQMVQDLIWLGVAVNHQAWKNGMTPLMAAALYNNVAAIRPLIEAGADIALRDPRNGWTAAEWASNNGSHSAARLLREMALPPEDEVDAAFAAAKSFADAAQSPAFLAAVRLVEECTGSHARPWKRRAGVVLFSDAAAEEILRKQIRKSGFHLIAHDQNLLLFPTADKFAVIASSKTSGVNYGLTPRDVLLWLIEFDRLHPFVLLGCGADFIEGMLLHRPDALHARPLIETLCEFAPDLANDVQETERATDQLRITGRFYLWWD